VRTGARDARLWRAFLVLRASEHARGSRDVRRHAGERSVVVLAYHAVADLSADPVLAPYGVPPERLAAQLDALARDGWRFVDLDTLLQGLDGEGAFPQRGVLVTFDDCYADLVDAAPLLEARGIRAVAFAVADRVGGSNDWDSALGAEARPLADANGLQALERRGVEIGSHGATHRRLAGLADGELRAELEGSAAALAKLGVRSPRALSYPHGVWDSAVAAAARSAGYRAAFTVSPGAVRGGADRYALPRVEVLAGDDPEALALRASAAASRATRVRRLALLSARARRAAPSRTAA
jgi:peptidoglycan/xylan/chitin deacetylase (PgdA/CDA1 family)